MYSENSLLLSHLPDRFCFSKKFQEFRSASRPPGLAVLADRLTQLGVEKAELISVLDQTCTAAEKTFHALRTLKIQMVDYWSEDYPAKLRDLRRAPWNLFFLGRLPQANPSVPSLAIVGSRQPNQYGIEVLARFLPALKTRPLELVSGLAYGIDSIAHAQACMLKVPNYAVLGNGLDHIYPTEHESLAIRILEGGGGILSEYPPETQPLPQNFPRRNRIIAALADVVWIVQGATKSGSLHTAKHALELGRTIVVTPGDIFSELSDLPHKLLVDGAHVAVQPRDLDILLGFGF